MKRQGTGVMNMKKTAKITSKMFEIAAEASIGEHHHSRIITLPQAGQCAAAAPVIHRRPGCGFNGRLTFKRGGALQLGLALASVLMLGSWAASPLNAQIISGTNQSRSAEPVQAASLAAGADSTITLTKMLEIYEFEGLKVAVDQYKINRGDSLMKVLQSRGLLKNGADQARMLRLVKDLNPDLESVNTLMPGQIINVPSLLTPQEIEAAERVSAGQAEGEPASHQDPAAAPEIRTETVKEYPRAASSQQPAWVRSLRNLPSDGPAWALNAAGGQNQISDAVSPPQPVQEAAVVPPSAETPQPQHAAGAEGEALSLAQAIVKPPVVTMGEVAPPPASEGNLIGGGALPGAPATARTETAAPAAPSSPAQSLPVSVTNYSSGNAGDLGVEASSGVVYRTVKVRKGDTLERLLRREGMHRDLIYGHLLKVTLELNPELNNPDLILAGAEIRIPAAGDYLTALAGVDPNEVRSAATAVAERRRPQGGGAGGGVKRAAVSEKAASPSASPSRVAAAVVSLPDETSESAKNSLSLLFTRMGERVDSRGQAFLSNDAGGGVELNTSEFPVVQLRNGVRLALDPGSRLSKATVRDLRALRPPLQVFQTGKKEGLDRALGRLWPLCGFYRVFDRERTYEGGGDIKLRITADWMVWPTEEAWASGQPLVVNNLRKPDQRTDPAWISFLEDHGIKLIDLHKNLIMPPPEAPAAKEALATVTLNSSNPSLFAAELVKHLGKDPKVGIQLDLVSKPGEPVPANVTAPVLWETDKLKVVLEFGELPRDALQTLRDKGYRVISAQKDNAAVVKAVLDGYGLKAQDSLTVSAPAGGPKMSLVINGKYLTANGRKYLITHASLPSGLGSLLEPGLTVLKY